MADRCDPYDSIEIQRWRNTKTLTISLGNLRVRLECDEGAMYMAMLEAEEGDFEALAEALKRESVLAQARKHFGLPYHNDGSDMFEEYASLCLADRVNPDTRRWYEQLCGAFGAWEQYIMEPPEPPVTFDEYLLRLYRLEKYGEPWADPWQPRTPRDMSPHPKDGPTPPPPAQRRRARIGKFGPIGERELVRQYFEDRQRGLICDEDYYEYEEDRRRTIDDWCEAHGTSRSSLWRYCQKHGDIVAEFMNVKQFETT